MMICEAKKCTGCGACVQICPIHAITMQTDAYGFRYPDVNGDRCTNCHLCQRICPSNKEYSDFYPPIAAYAFQAWQNCREIQKESASGGAFYYIARNVIQHGGVVFGCAWGDHFQVRQICVTDEKELYRLQKSKYIQSDTGNTYKEAKAYLESGTLVLYSGTPCLIAGLKSFLRKSYSNLITVDIVCHGVPSQKLFDDYLAFKATGTKKKLIKYEFRTTDSNRPKYDGTEWWKSRGKIKKKPLIWQTDSYYSAFMYGLSYRESCYSCPYAQQKRVSDITLGDFWGIQNIRPEINDAYGVSLVLVNQEKGARWFLPDDESCCVPVIIEMACKYNAQLNNPFPKPPARDKFLQTWKNDGYKEVDKKFHKTHLFIRIKAKIVYYLPKKVKNKVKNWRNRL